MGVSSVWSFLSLAHPIQHTPQSLASIVGKCKRLSHFHGLAVSILHTLVCFACSEILSFVPLQKAGIDYDCIPIIHAGIFPPIK